MYELNLLHIIQSVSCTEQTNCETLNTKQQHATTGMIRNIIVVSLWLFQKYQIHLI